jgi:hypothetical protein
MPDYQSREPWQRDVLTIVLARRAATVSFNRAGIAQRCGLQRRPIIATLMDRGLSRAGLHRVRTLQRGPLGTRLNDGY